MSLNNLTKYKNTFVVITGANSGIGYKLTKHYSQHGINVLGIDQDVSELNHPYITPIKTDLSNEESWKLIYDHPFFSLEILKIRPLFHWYNNAGISGLGEGTEQDISEVKKVFDINFWAAVYGTRFAIKIMNAQRSKHPCSIINISSMSAYIPAPMMSAYSASKAALRNYSLSMSEELKDILVHVVTPGFVKTKILESHPTLRLPDWMSKNASDPDKTAKEIIEAVLKGKIEITPDLNGSILYSLWRSSPDLSRKLTHYLMK